MVKRNRSNRPPQLQHGRKSTPPKHDKLSRLCTPNPTRPKTESASVPLIGDIAVVEAATQSLLDSRAGFRLPIVMAGALLARGRRTASSWFRAAGVKDDWDRFYKLLLFTGKVAKVFAFPLLWLIFNRFDPGPDGFWKLAVDDSPTKRFGRHVEGANINHHSAMALSTAKGCTGTTGFVWQSWVHIHCGG